MSYFQYYDTQEVNHLSKEDGQASLVQINDALDIGIITGVNSETTIDQQPIAVLNFENDLEQETTVIWIYAGTEIRVGREDPSYCQWIIDDPCVSKKHFRIYSITYDVTKLDEIPPLVFCEDMESTNGTFVNNECIGRSGVESWGHLLNDGDVIWIKPHWRYRFRQLSTPGVNAMIRRSGDLRNLGDQFSITSRLLGTGQYGKVFLAKEIATSRQVACKIVDLDVSGDGLSNWVENSVESRHRVQDERKRLHREIKILSKLSHPHIIDLRKAFISNSFIYIFTSLAHAGDLFSYCTSHGGKLDDLEGRVICRQVVLALSYIHEKGIAHRDIKMENVLVMKTYDFSCRIVLTDFGFAIRVDQKTGRMNSRVGTEGYVAPEVEAADLTSGGYTTAADMWSLGALTFNILVGDSFLPREEYSQNSQENIGQFIGGRDFKELLGPRVEKFLRGLLMLDAMKRMTARDALQHPWFKKPSREGSAIEEACKRITESWKPREVSERVIEALPDTTLDLKKEQTQDPGPKPRRKVPEINPHPFIGLDHHLNPRIKSSRGLVLSELREKRALFVTDNADSTSYIPSKSQSPGEIANITPVSGTDLFGSTGKYSPSSHFGWETHGYEEAEISSILTSGTTFPGVDEDELSLGLTSGTKHQRGTGFDQNCHSPTNLILVDSTQPAKSGPGPGQSTQSPVERYARFDLRSATESVRHIPRHSNAKEYGEAVRRIVDQRNSVSVHSRA